MSAATHVDHIKIARESIKLAEESHRKSFALMCYTRAIAHGIVALFEEQCQSHGGGSGCLGEDHKDDSHLLR